MTDHMKPMMLAAAVAVLATAAYSEYAVTFPASGGGDSIWTGGDTSSPETWSVGANWANSKPPAWYLHGNNYNWYRAKFNLSSAATINMGSYVLTDAAAKLSYGAWGILVESGSAQLTIEPGSVDDKQLTLFSTSAGAGQSGTSFANYSQHPVVFNLPVRVYGWRAGENGVLPNAVYNDKFTYEGDNGSMTFFAGDTGRTAAENTSTFKAGVTSTKPVAIQQNHIVKLDGANAFLTADSITLAGTLQVLDGAVTCSSLSVAAGGTLGGSGTISGAVSGGPGAILDFSAKTALTFAGTADLAGFTIAAPNLDMAETYVVARGTVSLPAVPADLQSEGWMAKAQEGSVILKNTAQAVSQDTVLSADTDWSENYMAIAAGVTVDLNGHELKTAGVSLGEGAAFVNTGAKANLVIGCNGADKSFVFDAALPATIMPVFTGAAVEIPSTYIPAGGIGFKDTVGEQPVYHESCANGLAFLGNAACAEAGEEWTAQGTSLALTVSGTGNTLRGGDAEANCWRNITLSGDGYLTMQRNAQWSIGFSGSTKDFAGTLHLKQGANQWASDYFGIGTGDLSFASGTIVLEPSWPDKAYNVFFSNNKAERHIGDLQTAGDYGANALFKDKNNATVKVGFLNNDSTFAGKLLPEGSFTPNFVKVGTGTWTLSGEIANAGTFSVNEGTVNFAGATIGGISGLSVGSDGRISGTCTIPAEVPVSLAPGATVSGALTFKAAPAVDGTAKFVPAFSGATASKLTFDYDNPSLAAFAIEAETIPVVAAGTAFVVAEGPAGGTIVAPSLGDTAVAAGWQVGTDGNAVVLTTTKLPPLEIAGEYSLSDDYDYSTGTISVADGAVIDLCGHSLKVGGISFSGSARFTNSAAAKANLEAGCEGCDKSWLWTVDGLTLDAGVRPVITGEAIEIPGSFAPAGGIGFKDTIGEQLVYPESCANGLAFLGGAKLKEPSGTWASIEPAFQVQVEGEDNAFTFDNAKQRWEQSTAFKKTPFCGGGELTLKASPESRGRIALGNNDVDNTAFAGTIRFSSHTAAIWDDNNASNRGFRNGTIVLANDDEQDVKCELGSGNYSSPIHCNIGSLVTEGACAGRISLAPVRQAGGVCLYVGRDGIGGGTFAGSFVNIDGDNNTANFDIVKFGTGTWTLTGTVANGGGFAVNEGTVAFNSGLSNVARLTVEPGATAGFCGDMGAASALELKAGSNILLDVGAAAGVVPVVDGDLDLSNVNITVNKGSWNGKGSRNLLRTTGTLTVDPAKITTDLDTEHYKFEIKNGNTLRYSYARGLYFVVR